MGPRRGRRGAVKGSHAVLLSIAVLAIVVAALSASPALGDKAVFKVKPDPSINGAYVDLFINATGRGAYMGSLVVEYEARSEVTGPTSSVVHERESMVLVSPTLMQQSIMELSFLNATLGKDELNARIRFVFSMHGRGASGTIILHYLNGTVILECNVTGTTDLLRADPFYALALNASKTPEKAAKLIPVFKSIKSIDAKVEDLGGNKSLAYLRVEGEADVQMLVENPGALVPRAASSLVSILRTPAIHVTAENYTCTGSFKVSSGVAYTQLYTNITADLRVQGDLKSFYAGPRSPLGELLIMSRRSAPAVYAALQPLYMEASVYPSSFSVKARLYAPEGGNVSFTAEAHGLGLAHDVLAGSDGADRVVLLLAEAASTLKEHGFEVELELPPGYEVPPKPPYQLRIMHAAVLASATSATLNETGRVVIPVYSSTRLASMAVDGPTSATVAFDLSRVLVDGRLPHQVMLAFTVASSSSTFTLVLPEGLRCPAVIEFRLGSVEGLEGYPLTPAFIVEPRGLSFDKNVTITMTWPAEPVPPWAVKAYEEVNGSWREVEDALVVGGFRTVSFNTTRLADAYALASTVKPATQEATTTPAREEAVGGFGFNELAVIGAGIACVVIAAAVLLYVLKRRKP